ncbi:pilin [Actinokineospora inagensis]|uniref:pilin n=1 Tax=Actinokineospora inagensis TaxID=103730 RepID=UPI00042088DD
MRLTNPANTHSTTSPRSTQDSGRPTVKCRRLARVAVVALALLVLLAPGVAHAETVDIALAASFTDVLNNIRNWLIGILGGIATVFLTLGGVRRSMAGGDPGEHEKAKDCFKAAGLGYGLAALAPLVVEALKTIVGL